MTMEKEIRFEIKKHLGVLETYSTGWRKEVNLISWNGGSTKYDIRDWSPTHEQMSRGITLHEHEMRSLAEIYFENQK